MDSASPVLHLGRRKFRLPPTKRRAETDVAYATALGALLAHQAHSGPSLEHVFHALRFVG
jgi:hypothetical protein